MSRLHDDQDNGLVIVSLLAFGICHLVSSPMVGYNVALSPFQDRFYGYFFNFIYITTSGIRKSNCCYYITVKINVNATEQRAAFSL